MSEIKNPEAYFATIVRNSNKDEYRANDNFYKHISSVGDGTDISIRVELENHIYSDAYTIESALSEESLENWMLLLESTTLHFALSELPAANLKLVYMLYVLRLNQDQCAEILGLKRAAVCRRHDRIIKILRNRLIM